VQRPNRRLPCLLALAMCAGFPVRAADEAPLAGVRQLYDGTMLPGVEVATFSHTDRLLPVRVVRRAGPVRSLRRRTARFPALHFEAGGQMIDLFDYLSINRVAGLLVLKDGEIVLEDYELGIGPDTRWSSWSIAKSISSTLTGAAIADGHISGLDDPVVRYVPALRGGVYEDVTIRQILTMSSGVRWNETYTDPNSDRRKLLELQIAQKPGEVLKFMSSRGRAGAPGSIWNYNTGETIVLGAVIEGAVHRPLAKYLSDKIWSKVGMEHDATWWVASPNGIGVAGTGLGVTLRDYGRFGLLAANDGRIDGKSIVPSGWFDEASKSHIIGGKPVDYGFMWWIPPHADPLMEGAFEAIGIFGQYIYVNRRERLVIVELSARSKPESAGRFEVADDAFFLAVTKALH
jgi:CubicO group peptidase (beta-lactamase class C family)